MVDAPNIASYHGALSCAMQWVSAIQPQHRVGLAAFGESTQTHGIQAA